MLYATRGIGKTWFGLELAISVATGRKFFEYDVPQVRNVFFVDGEMSLSELKMRLRALPSGKAASRLRILPSELVFQKDSRLSIHSLDDQLRIMAVLDDEENEGRKPDLIIIDNLSSLSAGVDENDNTQQENILKWLLKLKHSGFAVLLVHHAGKTGDQRGASRREDLLDTVIKLEKPDNDDGAANDTGAHFILTFTKTRGEKPKPSELDIKLVTDQHGNAIWSMKGRLKNDRAMEALKCIAEDAPGTQKELAEIMGVSAPQISQWMKTIRARGYVEKGKVITITKNGREALKKHWPQEFRTAEEISDVKNAF